MNKNSNLIFYNDTVTPFGKNFDDDLNYLLTAIDENNLNIDKSIISQAFTICYQIHKNSKHTSGVPFYVHPLSVALILVEELQVPDTVIITVALLHEIKIDAKQNDILFIQKEFDSTISKLVYQISDFNNQDFNENEFKEANSGENNKKIRLNNQKSELINQKTELNTNKAEAFRKLFLQIIKDIRIFIIKLCCRLHEIRTIQHLSPQNQIEIATETLNFYTPFAYKFGFQKIKSELESRAFYFYNKQKYLQILDFLKVKKQNFTEYIFVLIDDIKSYIDELNISHNIKITHKQEYEIFRMLQEGKSINDIDNLFSLEIVLNSDYEADCNKVYKQLSDKFNTINFLDLLNQPTVEFDRSLNFELFGPNGKINISIKTKRIEEDFSQTILKKFTENNSSFRGFDISDADAELWGSWMTNVINTKEVDEATQIIKHSIINNVYNDKITVYTRNNTPILLPKGATVIDFAFALSNEIGLSSITCKINGVINDLFYELKDGEKIEIITSQKCSPDSSWLNHIITYKAICYLSNYFKTEYKLNTKNSNSNEKNKNNNQKTEQKPSEQTIKISGIDSYGILSEVKQIIGLSNIKRISLASDIDRFNIAIQTNICDYEKINKLFLDLITVNGIKSISAQPIA